MSRDWESLNGRKNEWRDQPHRTEYRQKPYGAEYDTANSSDSRKAQEKHTGANEESYFEKHRDSNERMDDARWDGSRNVMPNEGQEELSMTALFSSRELRLEGEVFHGAIINSVFGGVKLDLDEAIIQSDVRIDIMSIFGGVDIWVPANVNVVVNSMPIFGGVSNKSRNHAAPNAPTIYIRATCIFGGVDIK